MSAQRFEHCQTMLAHQDAWSPERAGFELVAAACEYGSSIKLFWKRPVKEVVKI